MPLCHEPQRGIFLKGKELIDCIEPLPDNVFFEESFSIEDFVAVKYKDDRQSFEKNIRNIDNWFFKFIKPQLTLEEAYVLEHFIHLITYKDISSCFTTIQKLYELLKLGLTHYGRSMHLSTKTIRECIMSLFHKGLLTVRIPQEMEYFNLKSKDNNTECFYYVNFEWNLEELNAFIEKHKRDNAARRITKRSICLD